MDCVFDNSVLAVHRVNIVQTRIDDVNIKDVSQASHDQIA